MREMKNSGIEWIGDIPSDWKLKRNKVVFSCSKDIVGNNSANTQLLSLTTRGVKLKSQDTLGGKTPESFDTYQYVNKDDIIMCLFDLDCSAVFSGISPYDGMISPAYKILKCRECVYPQYADYWFSFVFIDRKFKSYSKNLRYTLNYDEFANLLMLCPSYTEQKKIADFLEEKCAEIDKVIEKTKATIEEYKKLKQSVITQAVTKGIRPNRPMKDSGIEWIGDIPADWNRTVIKRFCNLKTGSTPSTRNTEWFDGDLNWFTPGDFNENYTLYYSERNLSQKAKDDDVATIIPIDTVMIVGIGGTAGKIGITSCECSCNQQITALISEEIDARYLMYWMITNSKFLKETALYTTLPILNNQTIGEYVLIVPGNKNEQKDIASYLDKKCSEIDELISKKTSLLTELESYKKSLIYEYVTGKKEV